MGFWERDDGTIKVAILGSKTVTYLHEVLECLDEQGIACKLTQQHERDQKGMQKFQLRMDMVTAAAVMDVICCEVPPLGTVERLKEAEACLRTASHIINPIPIKWFAEFRYNVDSSWGKVEQWTRPHMYQRELHVLSNRDAFVSWVLTGAEKARLSSSFFDHAENSAVFTEFPSEPHSSEDTVQEVMQKFLNDIGESVFLQQMGEKDIVGLGFFTSGTDGYLVSERASRFWVLRSFSQVLHTAGLYDS
ncbi:MAG: hypothetical protein K2N78_00950 [Oscillospiraceae bacterium]|nr:hypothetical protein [Oscillospiraceae bacterium]